MKVIKISQPGGPEVLQLADSDIPKPEPGEVLIQVKASGVNRPDVLQRMGSYPAPQDAPPDIPGLEIAGIVQQLGRGVSNFQVGDQICALVSGGGYAEYAKVPALQCLPIPEGLDFYQAASLPETYFTVWNNIFDIANFQQGQSVLVHGGSSGIGVAAIQMVTAMGGRIFVTAGTAEKCQACEELGAANAINYQEEDFVSRIRNLTNGAGVDIVLDMIGGDYAGRNIKSLKSQGRLVMINAMNGRMGNIDLLQIMSKRLVVTGSTLRPRSVEYKGRIAQNLLKHIWPLIPSKIKPVVFKIFPLDQAAQAHELMESSVHIGKIILAV